MSHNNNQVDALAYMTATQTVARGNRAGLTTAMVRRAVEILRQSEIENPFPQWSYFYFSRKPKNHQYEFDFDSKIVTWDKEIRFV